MKVINLLTPNVFNLISAGEVVERPASVVKELVENSIDAGATRIKIEIFGGGIEKIKVTDNGEGISPEFVKTAFMQHATSKIKDADDLEAITTLGFRGEALPSIASVSMVELRTKTAENDFGSLLCLKGGVVTEEGVCGLNVGTEITVSNLFFNTPARVKFLKKPKTEETAVTKMVVDHVFSNPYVAFEYFAEGKLIFKTKGEGLLEAINSVYPRDIAVNFARIENTNSTGIFGISGYMSLPTYQRPNRSYQIVMINGRPVENKTVVTAIEKAYEGKLMTRSYPMFVVNLTLPYDFVDVNVHPAKTEVRFADAGHVYGFVYKSAVEFVNEASLRISEKVSDDEEENPFFTESAISEKAEKEETTEYSSKASEEDRQASRPLSEFNLSAILGHSSYPKKVAEGGISYNDRLSNRAENIDSDAQTDSESFFAANHSQPELFGADVVVLGQLFATYVLVEKDDSVYVIDQHAVHERMIYDRLMKNVGENYVQSLLIPYVFSVNFEEKAALDELLPELTEIGFEIEDFGGHSFKVSAVPVTLAGMDLDAYFRSVCEDISGFKKVSAKDAIRKKLVQHACKTAIKGGDSLNDAQIRDLLSQINLAEKVPLQCPHGRPAIVKISHKEVDKMFKRIV